MKGKGFFTWLFVLVFIIQIFQLVFFNRSYFLKNYDTVYWKDRFEHSQWQLPLSKRIIGDDGLFSYVGYTMANGADPSKNNPETQPVGKYLIGFSILFFRNPIFYSLIMGVISLLAFYFLAKKLFKNSLVPIFAALVLFLDPLFFSQFWNSWVDIAQLFFLLVNILFLAYLSLKNKHNNLYSVICGLSLGFFVQSKLPVLLPIIFILELLYFFKNKFIKSYLFYLFGFALGILIPYAQYFLLGHSLIDFIKLQKYILIFYKKSQIVTHVGAIWQTLILGIFPNISSVGVTKVMEWSILWPTSLGISTYAFFDIFKNKNKYLWKSLGIFTLLGLLIFGFLPSYPRYLLLIIPFLYLLVAYVVDINFNRIITKLIIVLFLVYGIINSFIFLVPKPDIVLNDFYYNLSNQFFQDIYAQDLSDKLIAINRDEFRFISQKALKDEQVKNIKITEIERSINNFSGKGSVKLLVEYKTLNLGSFSENKIVRLIKENSQWKIVWNWDLILNKFKPGYTIKTSLITGKRGSIIDSDNKIIAKDEVGYLISVNPVLIDTKKEQSMLSLVGSLANTIPVRLQNAYLENSIPDEYVPIATTFTNINDNQKQALLNFKGLRLSDYPTRSYDTLKLSPLSIKNLFYYECCSRIYSSFNYHGISGPERDFDAKLSGFDGGEIDIIDKSGRLIRTVVKKQAKNGQDVKLSL